MKVSFTAALLATSSLAAFALQSASRLPKDSLPAEFGTKVPAGLAPADHEEGSPDPEVLALGRALFFDPILSADRTIACASCHDPAHGFADTSPLSTGVRDQHAVRNTPSLFNRGFGKHFSWTGVADTLGAQVLLPISNPLEMGSSAADAVERLRAEAGWTKRFETAFASAPTEQHLAVALTAFVARIHIGDSPVDRFQAGEFNALDDAERAGLWIYESKGGCWRCHSGRNYSDEDFHATGIGAVEGAALPGRAEVTGDERDRGRFKTPTLRGVALTAPYMHDGSMATLEDVIAYYSLGGNHCAELDEHIRPLSLTAEESAALAAFLRALSRSAVD